MTFLMEYCIITVLTNQRGLSMRENILAILFIPVLLMFLIGFYILVGFGWFIILMIGLTRMAINYFNRIDFGFDKDYGIKRTKRKEIDE